MEFKTGMQAVYVSPKTGRKSDVVIVALRGHNATVAKVEDPSKTLKTATGCLTTREAIAEKKTAEKACDTEFSAKYAALNEYLAAPQRVCLDCGATHNKHTCPVCGCNDYVG